MKRPLAANFHGINEDIKLIILSWDSRSRDNTPAYKLKTISNSVIRGYDAYHLALYIKCSPNTTMYKKTLICKANVIAYDSIANTCYKLHNEADLLIVIN